MSNNSEKTDEKLIVNSAPKVTFCQRKKSQNGSFVSKLRNHFHEFIHASVDEHKTCLRNTIRKVILYFYCGFIIYASMKSLLIMSTSGKLYIYILFESDI